MMVGCSALMWWSSPGVFVVTAATSIASNTTLRVAYPGGAAGTPGGTRLDGGAIPFFSVMSASVKPRLAGRQPSNRGGVPRVIDQVE